MQTGGSQIERRKKRRGRCSIPLLGAGSLSSAKERLTHLGMVKYRILSYYTKYDTYDTPHEGM